MSESQRKVDPKVAAQMFHEGKSTREVADHFGVGFRRADYYRRTLGFPRSVIHNRKIDRDELRRLYESGVTDVPTLVNLFGVQRNSLTHALAEIGHPLGHATAVPKFDYDQIAELSRDGFSAAEIARQVGCSKETVRRVRRGFGISRGPRGERHSQELYDRAEAMLSDGSSFADVTQTLGVGQNWVRRHFPGRGWTQEQIIEYRNMKKQLDSMDDHV